jgi:sulfide dehydrogenase cytochrome subunit
MHKLLATVSIVSLIALSGPALGDAAQHMPTCVGCHGADGVSSPMPDVPIIAGIDAVVQEDALFAYRDGGRECWPPGVMCQISAALTDDDIVELAAHFAAMPFKPAGEAFDAALAAEGEKIHQKDCGICHGMDGPTMPESSILHGQKIAYLRAVMKEYAAIKRDQVPPMQKAISALTPEQTEALVQYYASYRSAP